MLGELEAAWGVREVFLDWHQGKYKMRPFSHGAIVPVTICLRARPGGCFLRDRGRMRDRLYGGHMREGTALQGNACVEGLLALFDDWLLSVYLCLSRRLIRLSRLDDDQLR